MVSIVKGTSVKFCRSLTQGLYSLALGITYFFNKKNKISFQKPEGIELRCLMCFECSHIRILEVFL